MKKIRKCVAILLAVLMFVPIVSLFASAERATTADLSGAVEFNGHYYKAIKDTTISWHDAKRVCEEMGGHLATISDELENRFVFSLVQSLGVQCWLGATDEEEEGNWKWVTGEPWAYCPTEFDNRNGQQHYLVMYYFSDGIWDDQSEKNDSFLCQANGYVCEWDYRDSSPSAEHIPIIDLNGAVEFNGHYYKIFSDSISWSSAKKYCEDLGGHLVTITSAEEQTFLIDLVKDFSKKNVWIGARPNNGIIEWITGEDFSAYTNWAAGEPNNVFNMQNAVMMYTGKASYPAGTWNDENENGRSWTGYYLSDFGFICEWDSYNQLPLESENLTLEQYMANVILDHNYNGVLRNMNGSTPQNYLYEYALQPSQIDLTKVYVDLLHQDKGFMASVAAWEVATFSPTDTYENSLSEIGYYEAVLMNVLNSAVKYTILPAAVKDVQKGATKLTSSVLKPTKAFAEIDYNTLAAQPWSMFTETEQLEMLEAAGAKCTALKKISGFNSGISDIFSTAADIREACEKIASLEKIAEVDQYVVNVLSALYENCPLTNTAMRTAFSEIKTVCAGSFDKTMVELLNGAGTVANIAVSTGVEALWNNAIAAVGVGVGAGVLIGQMIGKNLSNFLFSTDACLEQFYAMEALINMESVLGSVVKNFAANYKVFNTQEAAKNFLTAEKMLLGIYDLSADYAKDFTEIIKTKGIVNGIQSIFGFGNVQAFEEYCNAAETMKASIGTFKRALFDFDFGYARALQIDNPAVYAAYLSAFAGNTEYWNAKVMTVACPTNVEVYDENGQKVAAVLNNQLFGLVPGVAVWIDGDVKHLVLPQDGEYSVQITGTDGGTMNYTVSEFSDGTYKREIAHTDVPLTAGCTYDVTLPRMEGIETDDYILTDDSGNTLSPTVDSRDLKISGASLTLQSDLTLNYKVKKSLFDGTGFENPYILFEMNGRQTKVKTYAENGEYYVFRFENIAPNQLNDTVKATLCAELGGTKLFGSTVSYSAAAYCYNMLNRCTGAEFADLRTLLVDLLNYGAQAQLYTAYRIDSLANADLTPMQAACGTAQLPEMQSVLDTEAEVTENADVQWQGAGLMLENAVTLRFKLAAEDIADLTVKIKTDFGTWEIPSSDFVATDDGWYVYFNGLHAGQMRTPVLVTAYKGDATVSNTIRYSVESYAYAKQNSTIPHLSDLVTAMLQYGDSAQHYAVGKEG